MYHSSQAKPEKVAPGRTSSRAKYLFMNDFSMLHLSTAVMIKTFDIFVHSLTVLSLYLYF